MDRDSFVKEMDHQLKLVRTECGYTQETMAHILGISKKTLVEIEKGRSTLGWMGAVAFVSLFADSQVLSGLLGGEASDMIQALAFQGRRPVFGKTMGGHIWWRPIEEGRGWRLQQNIISQHYRALNEENRRICSSFDLAELRQYLAEWEELS